MIWAFDPSNPGAKKVLVRVARVGEEDYNDKEKLSTKIQYASGTYRITVPAFIVKMLHMSQGYNMFWSYYPGDRFASITFAE